MRVRLVDEEGVTWAEWGIPDRNRPPPVLEAPVFESLTFEAYSDPEPTMPEFRRVRFNLERRDGGGTYIYRKEPG